MEDNDVRIAAKLLVELLNQSGVDLDGNQAFRSSRQAFGQRATAGTNFDDERRPLRASSACYAIERGTFDQEMLAEPLAGQ